jgi:hypothetical protein
MNDFLETVSIVLLVGLVLALVFLFTGEPSLWDVLHERAMKLTC